MKRFASIAMLVVLFGCNMLGQAKWGGIARQVAMGGVNIGNGVVLNPFIIEDPAYMLLNPAYQTMYKDYMWMNIGGGALTGLTTANNGYGQQNAGINIAIDKEWTAGATLSFDPSVSNQVSGLINGTTIVGLGLPAISIAQRATQTIPAIQNVWELLGSYDGSGIDLGFGFMYGTSNNETNISTTGGSSATEASSRMFGFRAGGVFDLGGGSAVDFAVAIRFDKATDKRSLTPAPTIPIDGEYSATGTELQFHARGKFRMSNRVNLVPYAALTNVSAEPKEDSNPTTIAAPTPRSLKSSALAFAFGVGSEYKTADMYLAAGASFFTGRIKFEYSKVAVGAIPDTNATATGKYTAIPMFNLGGEWWFTDWLAGRAGYYRALGSQKSTIEIRSGSTSTTSEFTSSLPTSAILIGGLNDDSLITLGLGFRFGNFSLDATVSEEALRRGFGIVGSNDNINSFGYLNASLSFQ